MAFAALTAGVFSDICRAVMDCFAALLMFRGVVVSSETRPRTFMASCILSSYSCSFFFLTI